MSQVVETNYQAEVGQIVQDVFATMLGISAEPAEGLLWEPHQEGLTAVLMFAGSWRGAVLVECSVEQACVWTAELMGIAAPREASDDVRDSLGELVNMIGGNLKSVLPKGVAISMPTVVDGRHYSMRVCGDNHVYRMPFASDCGSFWVTLVQMLDPH